MDQQQRNLANLARAAATLNGMVALVILAVYAVSPQAVTGTGISLANAYPGVIGVIYFATVHQWVGRLHLKLSTLISALVMTFTFLFLIVTTGGLDSPFYSLWILVVIAAGLFGRVGTVSIAGISALAFAAVLMRDMQSAQNESDHLIQFIITMVVAGLAEYVHTRWRRNNNSHAKIEDLSGKLTDEQLKSQALVASIGDGVVVVGAGGQIQLFNAAAKALTGWDPASAQGIDYKLVMPLRDAADAPIAEADDPFHEAWKAGTQIVRDNVVLATRDGRKIALSMSVSPILGSNNTPNGAIALFRDISHEKDVQRQKDEFVSTASHEMRTPVAAIEGYISLAMNPNVATIDERAMKYLGKAHESIQHLGELFRDLLSVTKAEDGNLNMRIDAVNLSELLQSVVDDMQFVASKKGLTLVYQVSSSGGKALAPIYDVAVNPERLREVVMNLIDNAIKFTAQGGIRVSLIGNDKEVEIGVADTGLGIAAQDIPHLFQKFYRIDSSATRTIGGTGLGLYLCRTVVELFRGRIWVTSEAGQGSVFHIMLPRLNPDAAQAMRLSAAPSATPAPATSGSVLRPVMESAGPSAVPARPIAMPVPGDRAETIPAGRRIR